ncbi:MAG TPA: hypothetical protein VIG76_07080 [Amnibacterium sp.]|uniref:hypothetical protein n=1 Tax=Amnibacterium sp. TaxID=1872496 RepID=UPI002F95B74E
MQRVYFCTGTSFLTGDDVADAVLEYAWVLAQYGRHDLVRVPTRRPDGSAGRSTLLIGPMSQLSSEDLTTAGDELVDREFVRGLKDRSAHLREPLPVAQFDDAAAFEVDEA